MKGVAKLAGTLHGRTESMMNKPGSLDLATITEGYGLKPDASPFTVPKEDYLISRTVAINTQYLTVTVSGEGAHTQGPLTTDTEGVPLTSHLHPNSGAHVHNVEIPNLMRHIEPGDRVLIAWIGSTPVVVDIVFTASDFVGG